MALEAGPLLLLILLGGVVAIDGTTVGQFMISRPFVAASLAGWVVGRPGEGAVIGLVLEAFHLVVLPVGAARYPEGGPAAVVGGALYATSDLAASTLLLTALSVVALEWVGGESVRYLRQVNVQLLHHPETPVEPGWLERRHLTAIGLDLLRGMVLVAGGLAVVALLLKVVAPLWAFGERLPEVLLLAAVAGLLAGAARMVGWRPWVMAAGAMAGTVFLLITA